jgi:predicted amidohydrolase
VANWPERRVRHWQQLLIARAIENQSFVVGVNRVGNDGNGIWHSGHSVALNPLGEAMYNAPVGEEAVQNIVLRKDELAEVRSRFSFLGDRDAFKLQL